MPRRERPLEPGDGELVQFAADLRRLREEAGGLTYRQLSRRAHYSPATLSEAAGGKKLPSLAATRGYVQACGGDVEAWEMRWRALAAELAATPGIRDGGDDARASGPYVGLAAFEPGDADRFFGRDELVAELIDRIRGRRLVGVFGASGSGKSSVLRAGVVAKAVTDGLLSGGRQQPVLLVTPGPHPLAECAVRLAALIGESAAVLCEEFAADPANVGLRIRQALAGLPAEVDLLMVVDQFEEVFTLCGDPEERARFVAALVGAARSQASRVRVVLGVRADFYGHCGQYPVLVEALRDAQVLVGPMMAEELRQAITQPAVRAGGTVETALVARLIADVNGQAGVLPLLSHALLQTWRRRRGTTMTVTGYDQAGGIHQAVARTAEHTYTSLNPAQQQKTRLLFLRLTAPGEGTEDTKRRITRHELDPDDPDTDTVLDQLARARLITLGENSVDLAHETLIRSWPRLRDWLAEDRDGLRIHRHLTDATHAWQTLNRDPGGLYRGARLTLAHDWAHTNPHALTPHEHEFLNTSRTAETREHLATRRRTRRLRRIVALLAVLLLAATTAIGYAIHAQHIATQQRNTALAHKVIQEATALQSTNPALARQLALAAYRLDPTIEGDLLNLAATPYFTRLTDHTGTVAELTVSVHGHLLVAAGVGGTTWLWDITNIHRPQLAATLPVSARTADISDDGRLLATTDDTRTILWDLADPRHPREISSLANPPNTAMTGDVAMAVTAQHPLLVTKGGDQIARLWDISDPHHPERLAAIDQKAVVTVVLSSDGRTLITTGGSDNTVQFWDLTDPHHPLHLATLTGSSGALAISPDDHTLASFSRDPTEARNISADIPNATVHLWDITDPRHPEPMTVLTGNSGDDIKFSPDGLHLAVSGPTGARVWDITDPHQPGLTTIGDHGDTVLLIAFSPDGHTLITYDVGANIWMEELSPVPALLSHSGPSLFTTFGPDGSTIISAEADQAKEWNLMNSLTDPREPAIRSLSFSNGQAGNSPGAVAINAAGLIARSSSDQVQLLTIVAKRADILAAIPINAAVMAFSPHGNILALEEFGKPAVGPAISRIHFFDVSSSHQPRPITQLDILAPGVTFALNPLGDMVAVVVAEDQGVQLWNIGQSGTPKQLVQLPIAARRVAFNPHNAILATAGTDGSIQLWDLTDPSRPQQLSQIQHEIQTQPAYTNGPLAFSPTGDELATVADRKTIQLWNIANLRNPQKITTLTGHTNDIQTIAFSPDGNTIASTARKAGLAFGIDNDYTELRLWNIQIESIAAHICEVSHPRINNTEWNKYFLDLDYQPPCTE